MDMLIYMIKASELPRMTSQALVNYSTTLQTLLVSEAAGEDLDRARGGIKQIG